METQIHELHLQLDDDVFKRMKDEMGFRIMCEGGQALPDEFVRKVINAIDNGDESISLVLK